jgi:hypothetical protein
VNEESEAQRFWWEQAEWSREAFGPDDERGPVGALKHLEREAREAYEEADRHRRTVEIADCLFLVFDAARRHGLTLDSLLAAAFDKLEVNKARKWARAADGEPSEHLRE